MASPNGFQGQGQGQQHPHPASQDYSTLEVDWRAQAADNLPQVAVDRTPPDAYVPGSEPEAYVPLDNAYKLSQQQHQHAAATATTSPYTSYPETVSSADPYSSLSPGDTVGQAKLDSYYAARRGGAAGDVPPRPAEPRILGLRKRIFVLVAAAAALLCTAIAVGVGVGVSVAARANRSDAAATVDPLALSPTTRLAASNWTEDATGAHHALVVYQLNSGAIRLSTFNSTVGKWVVSRVVDDSNVYFGLDDVKKDTPIALDTYVTSNSSAILHLYWLDNDNYVKSLKLDNAATGAPISQGSWYKPPASDLYITKSGSSLAAYGRECEYGACSGWSYIFYQKQDDSIQGAGLEPGGTWQTLGASTGVGANGFDSAPPAMNSTPIASVLSRGDPAANGTRDINIFYLTDNGGALEQIVYERNTGATGYGVQTLPRNGLGAQTAIAGFAMGKNETSQTESPLVMQVLTADPEAQGDGESGGGGGVQLTYFKDNRWTAADGAVDSLAACVTGERASMVASQDRKVYCVVDDDSSSSGVAIREFTWKGNAEGDAATYVNYSETTAALPIAAEGDEKKADS